jgi:hypothetical protein
VVGWKITLPPKIPKFTSLPADHDIVHPYQLTRVKLTEKSEHKEACGVGLVVNNQPKVSISQTIKNTIQHKYQNGVPVLYEKDEQIHTALHESIAAFVLHHPELHNIIALHESIPWTNKHMDCRYAETQLASDDSGRYRDWCSFEAKNTKNGQISKLDSHVINTHTVYETQFPWIQEEIKNKFVTVWSSLPCKALFLPGIYSNGTITTRLVQSVSSKYKVDMSLIPVRDPAHILEKNDIHVYPDGNNVLMCYSSKADLDKNIDFMLFKIAD